MLTRRFIVGVGAGLAALTLILAGCSSGGSNSATATATPSLPLGIAALPGYSVSVFTRGTTAYTNPDSAIDDGTYIYIDYQNNAAKDGSDNLSSTVVQYDLNGKALKQWPVPGHSDGLREDPSTHLLWATSNEDGNPKLVTIDPSSGTVTPYTFPPTPHGGGYDDLAFLNGKAYIAASNPTVNAAGINVFPAVDQISLSNGQAVLTPVLMGDATATDVVSNTKVTINAVDPDSLTVDPKGNLVLVDQAGTELITIQNPGTSQQVVTRLLVGTQLDDTVWATSAQGRLLVVDATTNTTYWIRTVFVVGTSNKYLYTETPNDSGVAGFVGTIDPATGIVTPAVIGFGKPTGMVFVPDAK